MTTPHVSTGTKVGICAAPPAILTRAGFDALTYIPVRGVRVAGSLVKQYQTALFHPIGAAVPHQRRVALSPTTFQLDLFRLIDAGQGLLRAALETDTSYSFRVTFPRLGHHYFTAIASSRTLGIGGGTDLADTGVALEITSEIFEPL